jgi:hypothetical protein
MPDWDEIHKSLAEDLRQMARAAKGIAGEKEISVASKERAERILHLSEKCLSAMGEAGSPAQQQEGG